MCDIRAVFGHRGARISMNACHRETQLVRDEEDGKRR
jgi:hypothetical protein